MCYFLRHRNQEIGYYQKLNRGLVSKPVFYFRKDTEIKGNFFLKKNNKLKLIQEEVDMIKCLVLKNLFSSTSRSPIIKKSIELSNFFANYLKLNYLKTNKWQEGDIFLKDFNFEIERYFNDMDIKNLKIQKDFWWIFLIYSSLAYFPFNNQNTALSRLPMLCILCENFGGVHKFL